MKRRNPSDVIDRICCINLQRRYHDRYLGKFVPMIQSTLLLDGQDSGQEAECDGEYVEEGKLLYDKIERFDAIDGMELMNSDNNDDGRSSGSSGGSDDNNENRRRTRKELYQELRQTLHTICRLEWDVINNSKYDRNIRLNLDEQQQSSTPSSSSSSNSNNANSRIHTKRYLSFGEIGCIVSHVQLWKQLVAVEAATNNDEKKEWDDDDYDDDDGNNLKQEQQLQQQQCRRSSSSPRNGNKNTDDNNQQQQQRTMLILEDDVIFYNGTTRNDDATHNPSSFSDGGGMSGDASNTTTNNTTFIQLLTEIVSIVPSDFDILYLGFCHASSNGSQKPNRPEIVAKSTITISTPITLSTTSLGNTTSDSYDIHIFKPKYGFYTHAYIVTSTAANKLLTQHLPVSAPLDVWFADNSWFGLNAYVACIIERPSKAKSNLQRPQQHQSDPSPSTGPRPQTRRRAMSLIFQRSPLHDSDIIHSAHTTTSSTTSTNSTTI